MSVNAKQKRNVCIIAALITVLLAVFWLSGAFNLISYNENTPNTEADFWRDVEIHEDEYVPPPKVAIDNHGETSEISSMSILQQSQDIPALYASLKASNSDVAGWIFYPEMFSLPVMYCGDNRYYLNHNEYKKPDNSGALFLDAACTAGELGSGFNPAGLIHGHNLNKPGGFGQLDHLKQVDFFKSHRDFYIYDGKELLRYRVFSVFAVGESTQSLQTNFSSKADQERYINWLREKSMYDCTAPQGSDIVQLNTCDYSFKKAHLIVSAYKII